MKQETRLFDKYKILKITEGERFLQNPLFCKSNKALAVRRNTTCELYSTTTGEHLGRLFGFEKQIIVLQLVQDTSNLLQGVTSNGQVFRFNIDSDNKTKELCNLQLHAQTLGELNLLEPEKQKFLDSVKFKSAVILNDYILASWQIKPDRYARFTVFDIATGLVSAKHVFNEKLKPSQDSICARGNLVALLGMDYIKVLDLSTNISKRHSVIGKEYRITKMAMHPEESTIATADVAGRIFLWRSLFEKAPLKELFHWHSVPVEALAFTACGSHMFSGGGENVLVKWALSNRYKTFLPRLSGNIQDITMSPDNTMISVTIADGTILIINPTLACLASIQNFSKWGPTQETSSGQILTHDPRVDALVLSGRPGHLQFLSKADAGRFLYTLDVTQRNYVAGDRNARQDMVDVRFAKFSRCGKWLATAETGPEVAQLKFWGFDSEKQELSLNTLIDCPHGWQGIDGLEIGSGELAATIGPDKTFRIWGVVESVYMQQTRLLWAQLGYGSHRQQTCQALDIARDNTLIAVGFGPSVTLWDTAECSLRGSLTPPLQRDPVKAVRFGNGKVAHLVISGTDSELTCWNMVTLLRQWVVPLRLSILISDPNSCFMCAISQSKGLFIFDPSSPNPELTRKQVAPNEIKAAIFVTRTGTPLVFFITKRQELYCLADEVTKEEEAVEAIQPTPFASQLAERSASNVIGQKSASVQLKKFTADVLDGPAHGLPPVSLLCEDLLRGLLLNAPRPSSDIPAVTTEDIMILEASDRFQLNTQVDEAQLRKTVGRIFNPAKVSSET